MQLHPDFIADCPYDPSGLLLDELLAVDEAQSLVRVSMQTHGALPLTRSQRVHPTRHPQHVSGGLMVHMTGMAGFAHAYYLLGIRHAEGWIGYGAAIHKARFPNLATIGEPLVLEARATQIRRGASRIMVRFEFRFFQGDKLIYEGDQSAIFMKIAEVEAEAEIEAESETDYARPQPEAAQLAA